MAIQDSDSERRNLMVTSLCFIAYYSAGGYITKNEIQLQVLNVSFTNPEVLGIFAWILLFWFALRYWQTHQNMIIKSTVEDIKSQSNSNIVIWYLKHLTKLNYNKTGGFTNIELSKEPTGWVVRYKVAQEGQENKYGELTSVTRFGIEELIEFNGIRGLFVKIMIRITALIKKPGFSSYTVPYILFFTAIIIPVMRSLTN